MLSIDFESSDYYTIQEATDYLNIKHNLENVTPKKLLKNLSKFDIPLYVHGKGFNLFGEFKTTVLAQSEIHTDNNNSIEEIKIEADRLLSTFCKNGILFLQLHTLLIKLLSTGITVISNIDIAEDALFVGALRIDKLSENSRKPLFLSEHIDKKFKQKIIRIESLTPRLQSQFLEFHQLIKPKAKIPYLDCPDIYDNDPFLDSDNLVINFEFNLNDLLILHKDLLIFESMISDNNNSNKPVTSFEPKQGVSQRKMEAKRTAWLMAKTLWNEESHNKTRITEMAYQVYSILNQSDLKDELPDKPISIKSWIASAAPDEARKGGRPKTK